LGDLTFGLEVMLLGLAGVFIALSVLYFMLVLMDRFFTRQNNKPKPLDAKKGPAPPVPAAAAAKSDDELVAVITAALAVYLQKPQAGLVIRSITPAGTTNSWVHYGRTRAMDLKSSGKRRERRI
jgi:sodium pump decarboxylase gamma subunit